MYIMQISLRSILHDNIEMSLIRKKLMQFDDIGMINFTKKSHLRAGLLRTMFLDKVIYTLIDEMWIFFNANNYFVLMF